MEGDGILRQNNGKIAVSKGDFIAKRAAEGAARTFYNSGTEALVMLNVGKNEKEDTCYYPDEDVYLHKSNGQRRANRGGEIDNAWSSDPNPDKVKLAQCSRWVNQKAAAFSA